MDTIMRQAEKLAHLLKDCECYQKYLAAKKILESNPHLAGKMEDLKKRLFNIELNKANGIFPHDGEELFLNGLYAELMLHSDAREFLKYEEQVTKLLKNVINMVCSQAQLDLKFLD